MSIDYYLRDLTKNDWDKFKVMDKKIFPDEALAKKSFISGLAGLKSLSVVAIEKESKDFIGYFRVGVYGNEGHISRVGVDSKYLRQGIGSDLMERAMHHLKNAGCNEYYLYVQADNEAAIKLYEKHGFESKEKSYQFIVPYEKLLEKPKGRCRSVEWGEIQLISLRFKLNPFRVQQFFGRENQHVVVFEVMGQQIGFCRFNPEFPGGMPFIIKDPQYTLDFLSHLRKYITSTKFKSFKITFDNQTSVYQKLMNEKVKLNYELLKMTRDVEID
ncbi:MAG: GNAT family N-acetyltransferase [Asgard group archaeon]|nr:GNAT family N-acetyltransferase [Asgard group archaeon]